MKVTEGGEGRFEGKTNYFHATTLHCVDTKDCIVASLPSSYAEALPPNVMVFGDNQV